MTRDRLLKIMINTFVSCMNPGYPKKEIKIIESCFEKKSK